MGKAKVRRKRIFCIDFFYCGNRQHISVWRKWHTRKGEEKIEYKSYSPGDMARFVDTLQDHKAYLDLSESTMAWERTNISITFRKQPQP